MYKYMLLIILSLGIHSHFVPLKITASHSQHKDIIATIVNEIVCLLKNTTENFKGHFNTPENVTCLNCSHEYTITFIQELHKLNSVTCKLVLLNMEKLKELCPFLQKKFPGNHSHCETVITDFSSFKEKLKEFVCWVNEKNICNTTQKNGQRRSLHISPQYSCAALKNY